MICGTNKLTAELVLSVLAKDGYTEDVLLQCIKMKIGTFTCDKQFARLKRQTYKAWSCQSSSF